MPCPCCTGDLGVIGSRKRIWTRSSGERHRLIIRRMKCALCSRIHHELPDLLVPFKHYDAESIEGACSDPPRSDIAADESTLLRWRCWFAAWAVVAQSVLASLSIRFHLPVARSSATSRSVLHGLGRFVGTACGWLARAVRPIVNSHAWTTDPLCLLVR